MGIVKLDAYVLILRGKDRLSLVNGLSTNKVETTCTTVFTTTKAKIIDMVDVIDKGDFLALVGHGPYKQPLIEHISQRILGQDVTIGDASSSNSVFLSTEEIDVEHNVTKCKTFRGWIIVAPLDCNIEATMSQIEFDQYRVSNMIPMQGAEITPKYHPLACGLGDLVHEAKGCYIGQEIMARMRSRGKQGKVLVRLPNPIDDATTTGESHSLAIRRSQ